MNASPCSLCSRRTVTQQVFHFNKNPTFFHCSQYHVPFLQSINTLVVHLPHNNIQRYQCYLKITPISLLNCCLVNKQAFSLMLWILGGFAWLDIFTLLNVCIQYYSSLFTCFVLQDSTLTFSPQRPSARSSEVRYHFLLQLSTLFDLNLNYTAWDISLCTCYYNVNKIPNQCFHVNSSQYMFLYLQVGVQAVVDTQHQATQTTFLLM